MNVVVFMHRSDYNLSDHTSCIDASSCAVMFNRGPNVIKICTNDTPLNLTIVPERVGEANECQRDDVVHHHDCRVLPPSVHVDGSIDGVAVEAALDQVSQGDVCRHRHTTLPVWRSTERQMNFTF